MSPAPSGPSVEAPCVTDSRGYKGIALSCEKRGDKTDSGYPLYSRFQHRGHSYQIGRTAVKIAVPDRPV